LRLKVFDLAKIIKQKKKFQLYKSGKFPVDRLYITTFNHLFIIKFILLKLKRTWAQLAKPLGSLEGDARDQLSGTLVVRGSVLWWRVWWFLGVCVWGVWVPIAGFRAKQIAVESGCELVEPAFLKVACAHLHHYPQLLQGVVTEMLFLLEFFYQTNQLILLFLEK
jgi:hypothetical protein